jgi:hypothetical protein
VASSLAPQLEGDARAAVQHRYEGSDANERWLFYVAMTRQATGRRYPATSAIPTTESAPPLPGHGRSDPSPKTVPNIGSAGSIAIVAARARLHLPFLLLLEWD